MRHFEFLEDSAVRRLFHLPPEDFGRGSDRDLLATALGATLYTPATRATIAADLVASYRRGVRTSVLCLEDAIADADVAHAEKNLAHQLGELFAGDEPRPLVFVRVRAPEQVDRLVDALGPVADGLDGIVVPKYDARRGAPYLDAVADAARRLRHRLWVMPVIESREVFQLETRLATLLEIRRSLAEHDAEVLAVRIGATDLSAQLGLRRPPELTVYDVAPVASVIGDVVNVLGRRDGTGYVVTGPVWEHFPVAERIFKPQLRETPFTKPAEQVLRARLISKGLDGLLREVALDHANGLWGKTVIHPKHVAPVHALSVVSHEDFADASDIVAASGGGVASSSYRNKMNEASPHLAWARTTLRRGRAFGVAREDVTFVDLLEASVRS